MPKNKNVVVKKSFQVDFVRSWFFVREVGFEEEAVCMELRMFKFKFKTEHFPDPKIS